MQDPVSTFITAAGQRLRVQYLHTPQGATSPVLVFLHEGLGSIPQWGDFPRQLCAASGLPGLIYERWGFGESEPLVLPRPLDYLHQEATEALPEVLVACGITQAIHVGHSDGGSIALLHAAHDPATVLGVISEAAHVFIEDITLAGIREAGVAFFQGTLQHKLARYHGDNTETMFRGWHDTWLQPDFHTWQMLAQLSAIRCPVLAIQGEDDEYGSPAQVESIVERVSGPSEAFMVPNCGHTPHRQALEPVMARMLDFIQRLLTH